jgi:molybdopterin converting factor small subunit
VNAIPYMLANGSVYFFPKAGKPVLDKFCKIYHEIHKHNGGGILRIIPVVDTKQQREYLKHDVEKRIQEKYEMFLGKAKEQLEDISSEEDIDKLKGKWGEKKEEFERNLRDTLVRQYSELLKMDINAKLDTFVPASDRLQIAKKFMAEL